MAVFTYHVAMKVQNIPSAPTDINLPVSDLGKSIVESPVY